MERERRQLEGDDPNLTKLFIGNWLRGSNALWVDDFAFPEYLPRGRDWISDGRSIGSNTHIQELSICDRLLADHHVTREEREAFCEGLSHNKSIERLCVYCSTLSDWEIFTMLKPFFELNSNLCRLVVYCDTDTSNSMRLLSEALSRFATLKEFACKVNPFRGRISGRNVEALAQALAGHSRLNRIDLGGIEVGGRGIAVMAPLLNQRNPSLVDLRLHKVGLDDDITIALAACLTNAVALKKLSLAQNPRITVTGWRAMFTMLQRAHSSLEDLVLSQTSIDDDTANLLAGLLGNSTHLKRLDLSRIYAMTSAGWHSVLAALQSHHCVLEELFLRECGLEDEEVADLSISLSSNHVLKHLQLSENHRVTPSGWRVFSTVFLDRNSALETVELKYNFIDDDMLAQFANSLVRNKKLRKLLVDPLNGMTRWDVFDNLLCSHSSVMDTFRSNHTLESIIDRDDSSSMVPPILSRLFRLNKENSPHKAARRKIIKVHFSGIIDMQPFVDMDLKVLPCAIASMAEDEHGMSLLYQFVRSSSIFVGIGGSTKCENDSRSKRQRL